MNTAAADSEIVEDDSTRPENPPELVEKLVNDNIKLAHYFAKQWSSTGSIDEDEALSRAMHGLLRAAQLADTSRPEAFSTYAAIHIKAKLGRFFTDAKRVKRGGGKAIHVSLDDTIGHDDGQTYAETIADENDEGAFAALLGSDNAEQIHEWLARLGERERIVLHGRFGLDGAAPKTLEEVGATLKITRERVRQIEAEAIKKLGLIARRIEEHPDTILPKKNRRYRGQVLTPMERQARKLQRQRYYLKHKAKIDAKNRAAYYQNREVILARVKAWRLEHPEWVKKQRRRRYYQEQAKAILYSSKYYYANHAEMLRKSAIWREQHREEHRAYCRDKAIRLTDTYVREQLSKYHPTKSCWEWTPEEVEAKRQSLRARRASRLTDPQMLEIMQRVKNGEKVAHFYSEYPCTKSMVYWVAQGKCKRIAGSSPARSTQVFTGNFPEMLLTTAENSRNSGCAIRLRRVLKSA